MNCSDSTPGIKSFANLCGLFLHFKRRQSNEEAEQQSALKYNDMITLDDIPSKELAPGIIGKYVHGSAITFGYVTIKAGSILPAHHHIHEQITFVVEGELELSIGDNTFSLTPGTAHVIPSGIVHSAVARKDCLVMDVFSPARDDYR